MRKADLAVAIALLGLAALVAGEGLRLGIGWSTDGPRPGFFVFYLGLVLGVSAAVVVGRAVLHRAGPRKTFLERAQARPVATVLLPAAAMVLLTQFVGLYLAGALYLGTYMRWVGRHSWVLTVVLSLAIPIATFLIFEVWFLVPMPKGPIEALLGY
jgi:hypothetical protein